MPKFSKSDDLTGRSFNRLLIEIDKVVDPYGNYYAWCRCDCGQYKLIYRQHVVYERSKSCGCLSRELASKRINKNRKTGSEHHSWLGGYWNRGSLAYARKLSSRINDDAREHGYAPLSTPAEEISVLFSTHDGTCEICHSSLDMKGNGARREVLDHDHITGKLRGLICASCNRGLGHFKDSTTTLWSAIRYLGKNNYGQENC